MSDSSFLQSLDTETRSNIQSLDPGAASSPSDPASSLRAAALLTLKSKRRKPPIDLPPQTFPSRPPPPSDSGFLLDYGHEDAVSSPPEVPRSSVNVSNLTSKPSTSDVIEDSQIREEGEISDEEGTQYPPKPHLEPVKPPSPSVLVDNPEPTRHSTPLKSAVSIVGLSPKPKLSDRIVEPSVHTPLLRDTSTNMLVDPMPLDFFINSIDADHVRPGLSLNQSQYDTSKDIVLELLGWGVPPEYLIDCGLTREIIFYVFNELNLRLPQNLDTSGLVPYTPEVKILVDQYKSNSMSSSDHPRSHNHPSEPYNSPPSQIPHDTVDILLTPGVAPTSTESPSSNLHDMEQQRRQELLARKAAIASRKSKLPASTNASSGTLAFTSSLERFETSIADGQEIEMAVPTETVDDFLKTIGSNAQTTSSMTQDPVLDPQQQPQQKEADDMDVDEIPGLARAQSFKTTSLNALSRDDASLASISDHPIISPASLSNDSQFEYPPSSTESTTTGFNSQMSGSITPISESQNLQRRGAKRPVASDFVDFETGPRSHGHSSGYSNGAYTTSSNRPKAGTSFASIGGMRRCIIDLSDSEGEGDDIVRDPTGYEKERWGRRSGYASPAPTRPMITTSTMPASGWKTPPVSAITPGIAATSAVMGATSPAALMEKEIEIRKMRELIAQREQNRLKKAATAKSLLNIDTSSTAEASNDTASPVIKQEDSDFSSSLSRPAHENRTNGHSNGHRYSPPPPYQSSSGNPVTNSDPDDQSHLDSSTTSNTITPEHTIMGKSDLAAEGHEQAVNGVPIPPDTEGHQENESPPNGLVDVDQASSSSAQVHLKTTSVLPKLDENQDLSAHLSMSVEDQPDQAFETYDSLFQWYPLLGSRPRSIFPNNSTDFQVLSSLSPSLSFLSIPSSSSPRLSSFEIPLSSSSTYSIHTSILPVINLKPLKLATASKLLDPSKLICQYEVPGGGVCRDAGCDDIHLSRAASHDGVDGLEPNDQDTCDYLINVLPPAWVAEHHVSQLKISTALEQIRVKNPQMTFEERVAQALKTLEPSLDAPTAK